MAVEVNIDERIATALNGRSFRPSVNWRPRDGDLLAGTIVGKGRSRSTKFSDGNEYLDVKVEQATQGGQPVTAGTWLRVYCSSAVLRGWLDRDEPVTGDWVAIRYFGRETLPDGTNRHLYQAGVDKHASTAVAPWE